MFCSKLMDFSLIVMIHCFLGQTNSGVLFQSIVSSPVFVLHYFILVIMEDYSLFNSLSSLFTVTNQH